MTWFRVGGAGIPASLKNNMNSVLNKKFGTTGQNYPPNGWPADVNLLGPLPEKTVAGLIAHTDDAADTVPVKSVICSIVPKQAGSGTPSPTNVRALSGYTGMTVIQRNKNLLMLADTDYTNTQNNVTIDYDSESQMFSLSGVNQSSSAYILGNFQNSSLHNVVMKNATYTFSHNLPTGAYAQITYRKVNSSSVGTLCYIAGNGTQRSVMFTLPADYDYTVNAQIGIAATAGDVTASNLYMQIEVGSSASSFEAYNAAADISDSWSSIGAIYGGERDLTEGTLKKSFELIELKVSDMNNSENYPGWRNAGVRALGISTGYYTSWLNIGSGFSVNVSSSNDILFLPTNDYGMTQSQWIASYPDLTVQIIVPVGTPTEYTNLSTYDFETLYAVNNFYSDIEGGQTQLTYRQDIALALQAVSSSRGLMMASRPVTQLVGEESDLDQVNELVENDETEQEGEDNAR